MHATYLETKALPKVLCAALARAGFRRDSIEVKAAETARLGGGGAVFEGNRSFRFAVNLATGEVSDIQHGSWGGSNGFESKAADQDVKTVIPPNVVVVDGESGGRGSFARLYCAPATLAPMLPPTEKLSEVELKALRAYTLKSGPYRQSALRNVPTSVVDSLVERGFLARNRAGATKLTTKGRNASQG